MAKMLKRDLTEMDRALLANLTLQPGWKIVEAMFEEMCDVATAAVIQLDPSSENYLTRLKTLQMQARVTNDVCSSVLKSVETHIFMHVDEQQQADEAAALIQNAKSNR